MGGETEGAQHVPQVDLGAACAVLSSQLDGVEQAGGLPAATVPVHKGQWVLHVVLNHGDHRGEDLDRGGKASVGPSSFILTTFLRQLWGLAGEPAGIFLDASLPSVL